MRFDAWGQPVRLYRSGADEPEEVPPEGGGERLPPGAGRPAGGGPGRGWREPQNSGRNGMENVGLGLAFYRSCELGRRIGFEDGIPDLPEDYRNTEFIF